MTPALKAEEENILGADEAATEASKAGVGGSGRRASVLGVVLRAVNVRLSMGFISWNDHVATIVRHERIVYRALKTMQNRSLFRSFRPWVSLLEAAQRRRTAAVAPPLIAL